VSSTTPNFNGEESESQGTIMPSLIPDKTRNEEEETSSKSPTLMSGGGIRTDLTPLEEETTEATFNQLDYELRKQESDGNLASGRAGGGLVYEQPEDIDLLDEGLADLNTEYDEPDLNRISTESVLQVDEL